MLLICTMPRMMRQLRRSSYQPPAIDFALKNERSTGAFRLRRRAQYVSDEALLLSLEATGNSARARCRRGTSNSVLEAAIESCCTAMSTLVADDEAHECVEARSFKLKQLTEGCR
jgi:hypothetical protein